MFLTGCRRPTPSLFPYTTLFRSGNPLPEDHARMEFGEVEVQEFGRSHALRPPRVSRRVAREGPQLRRKLDVTTRLDRKSTRLNSSHGYISYAVFCLKKKTSSTPRCHRNTSSCARSNMHRGKTDSAIFAGSYA